jgi:hypothetical protein
VVAFFVGLPASRQKPFRIRGRGGSQAARQQEQAQEAEQKRFQQNILPHSAR